MSFLNKFLKLMPSSLLSVKGSNNWKLAKFYTSGLDEIYTTLNKIELYRSIENAEGKLLDNLGEKYGVKRGPVDDEFYRMMIRSKIANRKGDTTTNGILRTMQNSLNIDTKGVKLGPAYQKNGKQEPLALRLTNVPLRFARSEYEQEFMLHQIESIIAAGVRLQDLQFIVPLGAHWKMGGGFAYAVTFTVDDSKEYSFNDNQASFNLGATVGYTSVSTTDDSKNYSSSVEGQFSVGATQGTTDTVIVDDSKQYDNNLHVNLAPIASLNSAVSVELTDQFDRKFEIGGNANVSTQISHHEEYDIN